MVLGHDLGLEQGAAARSGKYVTYPCSRPLPDVGRSWATGCIEFSHSSATDTSHLVGQYFSRIPDLEFSRAVDPCHAPTYADASRGVLLA